MDIGTEEGFIGIERDLRMLYRLWGQKPTEGQDMEWVIIEIEGARGLESQGIWIIYMDSDILRMTARDIEERSTVVQVQLLP